METTCLTDKELFDELRKALSGVADEVPEGFLTSKEWSEIWNVSLTQTQRLLSVGVRAKRVEKRSFLVDHGEYIRHVPHYKKVVRA